MSYRNKKKDFRMTALEFERFDRVRRTQGFGYRSWGDFIRDALIKYVEEFEQRNPERFPPIRSYRDVVNPLREAIRETPTPLPAIAATPPPGPPSDKSAAKQKKAKVKAK